MIEFFTSLNPNVNWEEAMLLLVVRFIGVILVMLVMQVALVTAARVIRWIETRDAPAPSPSTAAPVSKQPSTDAGVLEAPAADDGGVVAAIALALDLEQQRSVVARKTVPTFSIWSAAGLSEAHDRLTRSR